MFARTALEAPIAPAGVSGLPTVLIADDDPVVRSALCGQLGSGFEVLPTAADAQEAITLAELHSPDVVIVDVQMPGGGGRRAVSEIASRVPRAALVVLSSDEAPQVVQELLSSGAMTYLRKGTSGAGMIATLYRSIEAHAALAPVPPATRA